MTVGERHGEPARPAQYRDIAVLYRSDTGGEVLASYRDALEWAGIPHLVPSRKGFFARQEVQDLRMVLSAIDTPADDSARYAAMKTIFFGFSDEEILPLYRGGERSRITSYNVCYTKLLRPLKRVFFSKNPVKIAMTSPER